MLCVPFFRFWKIDFWLISKLKVLEELHKKPKIQYNYSCRTIVWSCQESNIYNFMFAFRKYNSRKCKMLSAPNLPLLSLPWLPFWFSSSQLRHLQYTIQMVSFTKNVYQRKKCVSIGWTFKRSWPWFFIRIWCTQIKDDFICIMNTRPIILRR